MPTTETGLAARFEEARYEYAEGRVLPNEAARELETFAEELGKLQKRVDHSFVGAIVARLLTDHPWVKSLRLVAYGTAEYDDNGGTYLSGNVTVRRVVPVAGATVPDDFLDGDGAFDEDGAEELLRDELCDDESQIYDALVRHSGVTDEVTLQIDRAQLGDLFGGPSVNGQVVYDRLKVETQTE
jgi:hypothetical protein